MVLVHEWLNVAFVVDMAVALLCCGPTVYTSRLTAFEDWLTTDKRTAQ